MSNSPPKRLLQTAQQVHNAIKKIISIRSVKAAESQYDRSVCISAVGAAGNVFNSIPVEGDPITYGKAVVEALDKLHNNYHDSDGEYTSGVAPIGDVYYDVSSLVDSQIKLRAD